MINLNNYEIWFLDYLEDRLSSKQVAQLDQFLEDHVNLKLELEEMSMVVVSPDNISYDHKIELRREIDPSSELEDYVISKMEGDIPKTGISDFENLVRNNKNAQDLVNEYEILSSRAIDIELYPNKEILYKQKYSLDNIDTLILASLDGSISDSDNQWLNNHFSKEALRLQQRKFEKTRLVVDESIVYNYKDDLKKEDSRVVPLYWMKRLIGVAASLLLLVMANNWDINNIGDNFDKALVTEQVIPIDLNGQEPSALIEKIDNGTIATELNKKDIINNVTSLSQVKEQSINVVISDTKNVGSIAEVSEIIRTDNVVKKLTRKADVSTQSITDLERNNQTFKIQTDDLLNVKELDRLSFSNISSREEFVDVKMPKVSKHKETAIKKVKNARNGNTRRNELKLGELEVDMPELLASGYESVKKSKKVYDSNKKKERSIFSFSIGNFSVYSSKSNED